MTPAGLIALSLLAPAQPPAPQKGDELVFAGTVVEGVDRPGRRFHRKHDLEVRVLVLGVAAGVTDAAVLTQLRRGDDAVAGAVAPVAGAQVNKAPAAARLDLVRIRPSPAGRETFLLSPSGSPLVLDRDTPLRALPPPPLDTFAPFEFGVFPARNGKPNGEEAINGERCAKLTYTRQSADWDKPVGGQTAWQQVETVWASGRDGTVRRVHRLIRHRDGIDPNPAAWVETRYEFQAQGRIADRAFDRYRREIEVGVTAAAEVAPYLADAVRHGPRPFERQLKKIDEYLEENESGTPYREGVLAVRRQIDAARRGEVVAVPALPPLVSAVRGLEVGQAAPDFRAGSFRFADHRGKPAVLVFFKPASETTDLALVVADALHARYAGKVTVVPLVVFGETTAGEKDRDRLKLKVSVYDGGAAGPAYGADSFPRFVVVDSGGKIRWLFAGVGAETGYTVCEELDKLAPSGTTSPTPPRVGATGQRP